MLQLVSVKKGPHVYSGDRDVTNNLWGTIRYISYAVRRDAAATSLTTLLCGLHVQFLQAYWLPCKVHTHYCCAKIYPFSNAEDYAVTFRFLWTLLFQGIKLNNKHHNKAVSGSCFMFIFARFNLLKPTCDVMHQQFNIQQLYVLPTLYLCVLYLSENKQRLVPLTA